MCTIIYGMLRPSLFSLYINDIVNVQGYSNIMLQYNLITTDLLIKDILIKRTKLWCCADPPVSSID